MSEKGAAQRNGPAPFSDILTPLWKKRLVWGGKTQKKSAKKFLRLHDTYKMYILQKNWTKTVNPALSSGLNFFPPPIWGHHHQLDDQQRNPNMNNRDHLVGQLTNTHAPYQSVTFVKILIRMNVRIYSYQQNTNEYPDLFISICLTRTNVRISICIENCTNICYLIYSNIRLGFTL